MAVFFILNYVKNLKIACMTQEWPFLVQHSPNSSLTTSTSLSIASGSFLGGRLSIYRWWLAPSRLHHKYEPQFPDAKILRTITISPYALHRPVARLKQLRGLSKMVKQKTNPPPFPPSLKNRLIWEFRMQREHEETR